MKRILAHRIALEPRFDQESFLSQSLGAARFAYNWALNLWQQQFRAGLKPSEGALRKQLNAIKRDQFPWMLSVSKAVVQQAIKNLGAAFSRFFGGTSDYPRFKKRGIEESARVDNGPGTFELNGKNIKLPLLGWLKMREELRFSGKPLSATLSRTADRWFISISVEITLQEPIVRESQACIGVDLGILRAVTLSDGQTFEGPRPLKANLKKLQRLSKKHSKAKVGGKNRAKLTRTLSRLHARIANIREDWLHKMTTHLSTKYDLIGIEDLNVRGMSQNKKLAKHILDIGMGEFRRQLKYKCALSGARLEEVNRWFPSTKRCNECKALNHLLTLKERWWRCGVCGAEHDRDINAAKNIEEESKNTASCAGVKV